MTGTVKQPETKITSRSQFETHALRSCGNSRFKATPEINAELLQAVATELAFFHIGEKYFAL